MKKTSKKLLLILIPVLLFAAYMWLGFSGLCYSEFRYLSDRELVDYNLFGQEAKQMTNEEKVVALKKRGQEYPNCCRVNGAPKELSAIEIILNQLIYRRYFFSIEKYSHLPDEKNSYRWSVSSTDSCGIKTVSGHEGEITQKEYSTGIQRNEKSWKEMEK